MKPPPKGTFEPGNLPVSLSFPDNFFQSLTNMAEINTTAGVGILGAGIMGCCLALELALRGIRVDLIDLAQKPMTGASLHNEGKLHLGFVYANDPEKETYKLMLRGSLAFSSILNRLTGYNVSTLATSQPFHYFIPTSSQLSINEIENHFQDVENYANKLTDGLGNLYLDKNLTAYFKKNSKTEHGKIFSEDLTLGSFSTEERSISTMTVARILSQAINDQPMINLICNTEVTSAARRADGKVDVATRHKNKHSIRTYNCIANCLWDDRIRVDETAGIVDEGPWIIRYKATITIADATLHTQIPSATGILGSYGDVVSHDDGTVYVSWYPLCKRLQSISKDGRKLHGQVHKGSLSSFVKTVKTLSPPLARSLASFAHRNFFRKNIEAMSSYIPSMETLLQNQNKFKIGGGVILARGLTDIDDPTSTLHQRSVIGPVAYGSYITIDTGKYCTAPLFALEAADIVEEIL